MLESKWPSTSHGGRLRWARLRNVLLAVAQFRQPLKRLQKSGSLGSGGRRVWGEGPSAGGRSFRQRALVLVEGVDGERRPRSSLVRQSSWGGLSDGSSHESLTGPLVKSSSLDSVKTPAHSPSSSSPSVSSSVASSVAPPLNFAVFCPQR